MERSGEPSPEKKPQRRSLPARYYTDPEFFRLELERFFGSRWFCAGRAEEIPLRGSYVLRTVTEESLIILRDDQGRIRSYFNVCRHRGTRICEAAEGTFAGTIMCPYHAWSYNLEGRLIAAPHMENVPDFAREEYPLHVVHADQWDGHIFLNLGHEPASLSAQLGSLPEKFRPWGLADLQRRARIVYDVKANWKSIIQNYSECVHCPIIHPALQKLSHHLSGVNDPPEPGSLGGFMVLREGVESLTLDGRRRRNCLPALGSEASRQVYFYAILPNLLLSLHPDYMMTHVLWPRACDRTEIVCEWHFHPEEIHRPGFDPEDAVRFWDTVNREDWHVCELSQLGMKSRAFTPGPYSDREGLLPELDRLVDAANPDGT